MRAVDYVAYLTMAAAGMGLAALALCLASWIAGCAGAQLWRRVTRIYDVSTLWFYLHQKKHTGRFEFPPPDKDNP